jgi:hypothetical protein
MRTALLSLVTAALLFAGDQARDRFILAASKAVALFRSADSIAANLEERGMHLHPDLISLRRVIEQSLDRAEVALDKGDRRAAGRELDRAEGWLARYAKRLGGS